MEQIERTYIILFSVHHPIVIWWPEGGESHSYSMGYPLYQHVSLGK